MTRSATFVAAFLAIVAVNSRTAALDYTNEWRVVFMDGAAIPADAEGTIVETNGRIAGKAFCNRYTAAFQWNGAYISVSQIGSTRMACPPPIMALETTFLDILRKATTADGSIEGTLTIRASDSRTIIARRL
jgi:heat shock protein HslJ